MSNREHEFYGYDFDGVVSIGVTPRWTDDIIITGRCIDEAEYVREYVTKNTGFIGEIIFNPMTLAERGNHTVQARTYSGEHKARTIKKLREDGFNLTRFFEDDPIQKAIIEEANPDVEVVHIVSNLVQK
jgi:hypothetical protein